MDVMARKLSTKNEGTSQSSVILSLKILIVKCMKKA